MSKRILSVFALVVSMASASVAGDALVRVHFESPEHLKQVVSEFDDVASWGGRRYADIVVPAEKLDELNLIAPDNIVLISDIDKYMQAMGVLGVGSAYHTYEEAYAEMDSVVDAHPSIAKLESIGTSIEGRNIWAIKISDNVDATENEPRVLYLGNHHAREIVTVEIPLYIMRHLADNYGTDPRATDLVNTREIWIVPTVNPDGREYVEHYYDMWRKNRRLNTGGSYGVDLNRNYGYMWGYDNEGSSPTPSDETYRGAGPFSEPETQAVRDLALDYQFATCLSFHSYGKLILYPWGYVADLTPDEDIFAALGDTMASFNSYTSGPGATTIYVTNGDSDDWMYGEQVLKDKIYSYTFEVGTQFLPPESSILPLCQENLEPSLLMAEYADDIRRILPPAVPEIVPLAYDDDGVYAVSWTVDMGDTSNLPVAFALYERMGPSEITDNAETDVNWLRDGFLLRTTRYHSATTSFYGGKTNNRDARLTARIRHDIDGLDTLHFWCWYDIEDDWDYAYVEASTDGGMTFRTIPGSITTTYDPNGTNLGHGITGSSSGWIKAAFPLGQFADSTVALRFRYKTDGATLNEGFYADDIVPVAVFDSSAVLSETITETHFDVVRPTGTYYYEVRAKDVDGQWGYLSQREPVAVTGAGIDVAVAGTGEIRFTNPVRTGSTVAFAVPGRPGEVIRILDILGRSVAELEIPASGSATWGVDDSHGRPVAPGLYFVKVGAEDGSARKLVVLR